MGIEVLLAREREDGEGLLGAGAKFKAWRTGEGWRGPVLGRRRDSEGSEETEEGLLEEEAGRER